MAAEIANDASVKYCLHNLEAFVYKPTTSMVYNSHPQAGRGRYWRYSRLEDHISSAFNSLTVNHTV